MQELKSEADRKATEVERLRAAEKFMTKGTGEGECQGCGYSYTPKEGDDEYPVPKGTRFEVGHSSSCGVCNLEEAMVACCSWQIMYMPQPHLLPHYHMTGTRW